MRNLFFSNDARTWLTLLVLVGTRVSTIFVFAPFFGGSAIPARVKVALTVCLTVFLVPLQLGKTVPASFWACAAAIFGEVMAGLLLGLTLQFVIEGVQFAGQMLGLQMGFSLVNLIDPQTQVDTPVLSIFQQLIALLIFLQLNVHHWLLRALARSFEYLPPGQVLNVARIPMELLRLAGGILLLGLQIAAPVLVATMAIDIALAFVAKASPQLPALMVGLSLKSMAGLAVMIAAMAAWPRILERGFTSAILSGEHLLHLAH
jgi:flagellar biosynthetic protein FliR